MIRITIVALFVVSLASFALARNNTNLSREQIRSMHILDRPSRPGHFYGNAVRRRHARETQYPAMRTNPGMVWQGSAPMVEGGQYHSYPTSEVIISE